MFYILQSAAISANTFDIRVCETTVWRSNSSFGARLLHNTTPAISICFFSLLVNVVRQVTGYKPSEQVQADTNAIFYIICRKLGIGYHPTFQRFFWRSFIPAFLNITVSCINIQRHFYIAK